MTAPAVLSLCSGYGGLDLAVERVFGARTVAFAEIEDAPARVFAAHWPGVPNLGDLKLIDWDAWAGLIDIFTAGYPCQPFSLGGKRKGTDDPRHLWPYIAEGIRRVRPRIVILENVAGHRSMGLDTVLGDLAALGYDAQWVSLRASDIGAPHGRERIFILATDTRSEAVRLGTGLRPSDEAGQRWGRPDDDTAPVADANGYGLRQQPVTEPGSGSASVAGLARPAWADGFGTLADADADRVRREGTQPASGRHLPDGGAAADASSVGRREGWPESAGQLGRPDAAERGRAAATDAERGGCPRGTREPIRQPLERAAATGHREDAASNSDGLGRECLGRELAVERHADGRSGAEVAWGKYEPAIRRWERLTRPAPAPTETGPKGGQRLSPRFVEWMMGLPDGWVTGVPGLTRNEQLKALGNGVVPQQAEAALYDLCDIAGLEVAA